MKSILSAFWTKISSKIRDVLLPRPALLNFFAANLTIEDRFGSPGDTLMTAIFCREIKERYPRLKLNCLTRNPSLLTHDPYIDTINRPKNWLTIPFWYLGLVNSKDAKTNALKPCMDELGIFDYNFHARVYLTEDEVGAAKRRLAPQTRPIITINVMSREMVKVWPIENWRILIGHLLQFASVVQLGDNTEPQMEGVLNLGGQLSMRESMAVLTQSSVHIGPDSFLMHAANGVDVPSVIIFGGSRTPALSGYAENVNLYVDIECSPCWLHDSRGDKCPFAVKCMPMVTPEMVLAAVKTQLASRSATESPFEASD